MSVPRDIANIMSSSAIGIGTIGTDLFIGQEPITPDSCVTIYATGGFAPDTNIDYSRPTIQIRVRDFNYEAGYALADSIQRVLNGAHNIIEGGARYIAIWAMGDVNQIGKDDKGRHIFTVNFRIHRTQ